MHRKHNPVTVLLLAAALALPLGACGNEAAGPGGPATKADTPGIATTGKIALVAEPAATVTIGGKTHGTTPVEIALAPGEHEVVLAAEGFAPRTETVTVRAGETLSYDWLMQIADADGDDAVDRLARALGIEVEPFEPAGVHRGAGSDDVVLYWPRGKISRTGATSLRVDVSENYPPEDDTLGALEFRRGKEVLYRIDQFDPEEDITIMAMPAAVRDALEPGDKVTWGIVFEDRKLDKKHGATTEFKVLSKSEEKKTTKALEKLLGKGYVKRLSPQEQLLMKAKKLEQQRRYSEALLINLGILNQYPDSTLPFRGIVASLRRMDLKDTTLYQSAAALVGGGGKGQRARSGATGQSGLTGLGGGRPGPIPREFAMPKGHIAGAPTPAASGLKPGGMVDPGQRGEPDIPTAPTPDAGDAPGGEAPAVTPPSDPAQKGPVDPAGQDDPGNHKALAAGAADVKEKGKAAEAAEQAATEAAQQVEHLKQVVSDAENAATDPDADPAVADARAQLDDAQAGLDGLEHERDLAREAYTQALNQFSEMAREAAEAAAQPPVHPAPGGVPGKPEVPGQPIPGQPAPGLPIVEVYSQARDAEQAAADHVTAAQGAFDQAQEAVAAAEATLQAIENDPNAGDHGAATAALEAARQQATDATLVLDEATAAHQQAATALDAARQQLRDAAAHLLDALEPPDAPTGP